MAQEHVPVTAVTSMLVLRVVIIILEQLMLMRVGLIPSVLVEFIDAILERQVVAKDALVM
jgi:hypothetical protein